MANIVMTDATPMMMPNIVRKHRSLLLTSALRAILSKLAKFISVVVVWQGFEGLACRKWTLVEGVGYYLAVAQHYVAR